MPIDITPEPLPVEEIAIEIVKIERTDANVDNSRYEAKVPYEVSDEYGNKATLYRKEVYPNIDELYTQRDAIQKSLDEINSKISTIEGIK